MIGEWLLFISIWLFVIIIIVPAVLLSGIFFVALFVGTFWELWSEMLRPLLNFLRKERKEIKYEF